MLSLVRSSTGWFDCSVEQAGFFVDEFSCNKPRPSNAYSNFKVVNIFFLKEPEYLDVLLEAVFGVSSS